MAPGAYQKHWFQHWFQLSLHCVKKWMEVKLNECLQTHALWHIVFKQIGTTAVILWLYLSHECKFSITWTQFQMGQNTSQPCVVICMMCAFVCSSGCLAGNSCRQLKLFINALLTNTPANPIIWQAAIRAFALLLPVCLSLSAGSWYAISTLFVKVYRRLTNILIQQWFRVIQEGDVWQCTLDSL